MCSSACRYLNGSCWTSKVTEVQPSFYLLSRVQTRMNLIGIEHNEEGFFFWQQLQNTWVFQACALALVLPQQNTSSAFFGHISERKQPSKQVSNKTKRVNHKTDLAGPDPIIPYTWTPLNLLFHNYPACSSANLISMLVPCIDNGTSAHIRNKTEVAKHWQFVRYCFRETSF